MAQVLDKSSKMVIREGELVEGKRVVGLHQLNGWGYKSLRDLCTALRGGYYWDEFSRGKPYTEAEQLFQGLRAMEEAER